MRNAKRQKELEEQEEAEKKFVSWADGMKMDKIKSDDLGTNVLAGTIGL